MNYRIRARLEGDTRRLEVLEAGSGSVRMVWESAQRMPGDESPELQLLRREAELHRLFRRLFLLAAGDELLRGADGAEL